MQIALYQPDIPQNMGSILRLCACFAMTCHIIEPCGFILDDRRLKRVAMDYAGQVVIRRHRSWQEFSQAAQSNGWRIVLFSTKGSQDYTDFSFAPGDILLLGRESAGVPDEVAAAADAKLRIPLAPSARSLNIVQAASIAAGEALRQIRQKQVVPS